MAKSLLRLTETPDFARRMKESFTKTAAVRTKLGLPKAVTIEGVVHRQFPDGRLQPVDSGKSENGAGTVPAPRSSPPAASQG
jgi:hypothetical protein